MVTAASKPSTARTQATRARIIATAEQLFAERGVDSVSLNEITRAAEQKNRNAVHYHFGNKEALLTAVFEKHWQPISQQRQQMIADLALQSSVSLEDVANTLVQPVAARFEDPDGGLCYIKISAQLAASNILQFMVRNSSDAPAYGTDMTRLWEPFLQTLPPAVQAQRLSLAVGMLFHGLADHAILRESGAADLANTSFFVSNLVDSICAVISAPVSATTRATMGA